MKDGHEVGSVVLDPEYWDSFHEQMAELGNNLRDSGREVRQMSREEKMCRRDSRCSCVNGLLWLNYQTHIDGGSMFNTPPVVPILSLIHI